MELMSDCNAPKSQLKRENISLNISMNGATLEILEVGVAQPVDDV